MMMSYLFDIALLLGGFDSKDASESAPMEAESLLFLREKSSLIELNRLEEEFRACGASLLLLDASDGLGVCDLMLDEAAPVLSRWACPKPC